MHDIDSWPMPFPRFSPATLGEITKFERHGPAASSPLTVEWTLDGLQKLVHEVEDAEGPIEWIDNPRFDGRRWAFFLKIKVNQPCTVYALDASSLLAITARKRTN